MTTVSLSSLPPPVVTAVVTQPAPTTTTTNSVTPSAAQSGGDTATISGHAMLLLRMFDTEDPLAQPPVMTTLTTNNLSGNIASFLNMGDRRLIEQAYEYAGANGVDPVQVDNLAFDLALYRDTQSNGSTEETTQLYDLEGNPWVGKFNAHDTELAKRILTSPAINETDMDIGFLAYTLNPQRSHGHAVSFESLEKFISALSSTGGKAAPDGKVPQPIQPTNTELAQALYRIDHPYVGEKWVPKQPQDSGDHPLKHLSKHDVSQLMEAYKLVLLQGSAANLKFLDQMSSLAGVVQMQQDGSLNTGSMSPQAVIEHLGNLLQSIDKPNADSLSQGVTQDFLSIKKSRIDTSA